MERISLGRSKYGSLRQWFRTAESLGDFIGIRFGHLPPGSTEPQWEAYPHSDYDGIGAFAEILRGNGARICRLPQIKYYPAYSAIVAAIKHWPRYLRRRRPIRWLPMEREESPSSLQEGPKAIAWHVFDPATTDNIRLESRKNGFTVNTLLLKALTDGLRPFLECPTIDVPWMVPVNMRGGVHQYRDSDNHTSYVAIRVADGEAAFNIHGRILRALSRGEHWGNWHAFKLSQCITQRLRSYVVSQGLCMSQWSIGAFSNLGEWDPDSRIKNSRAAGDWLFCPPALRSQMLAAGCVSFQGRLSLTIQAHPELTTSESLVRTWMTNWVSEIQKTVPGANRKAVKEANSSDRSQKSELRQPALEGSGS